jgi:hypothetical protein
MVVLGALGRSLVLHRLHHIYPLGCSLQLTGQILVHGFSLFRFVRGYRFGVRGIHKVTRLLMSDACVEWQYDETEIHMLSTR